MAPEGAAICDNCDEILDASFLGADEITPVEGEKTDVGLAPTSRGMPDRLRKGSGRRPGGWNPSPSAAATLEPRRPYLADPVAPTPTVTDAARKAASDLGSFFGTLSVFDRWAAGATAGLLLTLALPWRWTRQDEEIIGLVAAWPVLLLGAAALALVYLRARKADAREDRLLRLAQLGASGGAAIFTGLFLAWTTQSHALRAVGRSIAIVESRPELGAYAGLLCAVAALFAALPALTEQ
ncbi:MAG: hypothetical protein LC689_23435 [Myxococcales bacterium]|nr:hypothetical protein [Myxococcales bacterium]